MVRSAQILIIMLLNVVSATVFAQFSASTSQSAVSVGDQFQVTYTLDGTGKNFQAPSFNDFNVLMGPSQSTSMSIVNGNMSQSISFSYVLQAAKEGTFSLGPASIESGGKRLQSNSLTIIVTKGAAPQSRNGGGSQQGGSDGATSGGKNVFLRVSADKLNVYRGEGIVVTYKLYTKVNLVNYSTNKLPSYDGFWSQEIQLPQQQLEFHVENVDGVRYNVADVRKLVLFPQRSGTLSVEPMEGEVIARVQVQRQRRTNDPFDQFFNDPFFNNPLLGNVQDVKVALKSEPIKINVRELPEGAPSTFTGAVGKLTVESSLDKSETKAHDAVTLKVKVSGKGNLKLIDPPKINFPAEFESYDPKINSNISATSAGVTGSKTFEYLIIPRNPGEFKIPVSGFSYFDLERKQYVSIPGNEFVLKVGKGVENATAAVVTGVTKSDIQFLGKDIRFIKTSKPLFIEGNRLLYNSPLFYSMLAAPGVLFAFLLLFRRRYEEMQSNVKLMKSLKANKVAKKRLVNAKKYLDQNKNELFIDEMFRALWGFISDKLQIPVSELSKENIAFRLSERNVSLETSNQFIGTLDTCEFARYAPGAAASNEEIYRKGIDVISKLEEEIR